MQESLHGNCELHFGSNSQLLPTVQIWPSCGASYAWNV